MDRGAWQATIHGVARVGHNLATKRKRKKKKDRQTWIYSSMILRQGSRVRWPPQQHLKRPVSSAAERQIQLNRVQARVVIEVHRAQNLHSGSFISTCMTLSMSTSLNCTIGASFASA